MQHLFRCNDLILSLLVRFLELLQHSRKRRELCLVGLDMNSGREALGEHANLIEIDWEFSLSIPP